MDEGVPGVQGVDSRAAETLARTHFQRLFAYCRTLLGTREEAEDACQEVFLTVVRRKDELAGLRDPLAWLFKVARLTCLYVRRKRRRPEDEAPEYGPDQPVEPASPIGAGEDLARVRAAMDRLPERYRAILALHYQQEMSGARTAEVLGVSPGAARVLLHRAVIRLRHEVGKA